MPTDPKVDPTLYVFRTAQGYVVAPFHQDIGGRPEHDEPARTATEVLERIAGQDVSLILNASGGDVTWAHGNQVTPEQLAAMTLSGLRL